MDAEYPVEEAPLDGIVDLERGPEAGLVPGTETKLATSATLRAVMAPFWASRLVVLISGVYAAVKVGSGGVPLTNFGSLLVAPSFHWDAGWYLKAALRGYISPESRTFFLYIRC